MTPGEPPRQNAPISATELALAGTALTLNILLNASPPSRYHVPISIAGAAAVSFLANRLGASMGDQGLAVRKMPCGVGLGLLAAAPIAALSYGGPLVRQTRTFYEVPTISAASEKQARFKVLYRIPFGTALPEEMIFRGALPAVLCRRHGQARGLIYSSLFFGLWHIAPALRQSGGEGMQLGSSMHRLIHAVASVVFTAGAGVGLSWLRIRSGSILAPWLVHAAANSAGYLAARRSVAVTVQRVGK